MQAENGEFRDVKLNINHKSTINEIMAPNKAVQENRSR